MRWYVTIKGETTGPHEASVLALWASQGRLDESAFVRDEAGGQWMPFAQSPLAPSAGAAGVAVPPPQGSEAIGTLLVAAPFGATFLIWFWIANMNLLQRPADSLTMLVLLTVLGTAVLVATEASSLGMGKRLDARGKKASGPVAWFIATVLLWAVAYPWYLSERRHYGRRSLLLAGLAMAGIFLLSAFTVGAAIESKRQQVLQNLGEAQERLRQLGQ